MKHLLYAGGAILLLCQVTFAAITNWNFQNDHSFLPSDSISFSYTSDRDTTITKIYFETGDPGLDTTKDKHLFTIIMIDNNTQEQNGEVQGVMADRNPADGEFLFSPGRTGLAPGLYLMRLTDKESVQLDSFRVAAFENPFRTISGKVIFPDSTNPKNINVSMDNSKLDYSLSAWTNAAGEYTLVINQATIAATDGKVQIRVDNRIAGFTAQPPAYDLDLSTESKLGLNFKFIKTTCTIRGTVEAGNANIFNTRVVLLNTDYNPVVSAITNTDGQYVLNCVPGTYFVRAEVEKNSTAYLAPKEVKVEIHEGDDTVVNFKLLSADAFIYGLVTVKGGTPQSKFAVSAWNDNYGNSSGLTDSAGRFSIPVVAAAGKYNVSLENWSEYPFPVGLIIENGMKSVEVSVDDTAHFNFIDKPSGGISGSIENATTFTVKEIFIRIYRPDSSGISFDFKTQQSGIYTFTGIPSGTYHAEAGMSMSDGNGVMRKAHLRYADETGTMKNITIDNAVVTGINWKFTLSDTVSGSEIEAKGTGKLMISVIDSTQAVFEKGMVMLIEKLPTDGVMPKVVRSYSIEKTGLPFLCKEIPNQKLFVIVQLFGKVPESVRSYVSLVKNSDGTPREFDFSTADSFNAIVTVFEKDFVQNPIGPGERTGNGKVTGKISYTGALAMNKMFVLLYDVAKDDWLCGESVSDDGSYVISKIPAGKYIVAAAIDTNGDKQAEAAMLSDSVLVFTDAEYYQNINITIIDKKTGTGSISGSITTVATFPQQLQAFVVAIPIDTNKSVKEQVNATSLMTGYQVKLGMIGDYSLNNLPAGAYCVVAIVESAPDSSGDTKELAFGVYGKLLPDTTSDFPFVPQMVIVNEGQKVEGIKITLITKQIDVKAPVTFMEKSRLPSSFMMQSLVVNRRDGSMTIRIAVPAMANVSFAIIDLRGRVVARIPSRTFEQGYHSVLWNTGTLRSSFSARGTYVLIMKSDRYQSNKSFQYTR